MGAPGLTSPIRAEGFENLQLNAGVFIANFDLTNINDTAALKAAVAERIANSDLGDNADASSLMSGILGMTSGGGTFTITRETRQPEVDGRRYNFKGSSFVDSMDGYITSTLVEFVQENWAKLLGTMNLTEGEEVAAEEEGQEPQAHPYPFTYLNFAVKTALTDGSYLTNLVWVGDIADGRYVAIEFDNALNTSDLTFTFADKNEGKLPFEFHAHQGAVRDYDKAPFRIHFFAENLIPNTGGTVNASHSATLGTFANGLPVGTYNLMLKYDSIPSGFDPLTSLRVTIVATQGPGGYQQFTAAGHDEVAKTLSMSIPNDSASSLIRQLVLVSTVPNIAFTYTAAYLTEA